MSALHAPLYEQDADVTDPGPENCIRIVGNISFRNLQRLTTVMDYKDNLLDYGGAPSIFHSFRWMEVDWRLETRVLVLENRKRVYFELGFGQPCDSLAMGGKVRRQKEELFALRVGCMAGYMENDQFRRFQSTTTEQGKTCKWLQVYACSLTSVSMQLCSVEWEEISEQKHLPLRIVVSLKQMQDKEYNKCSVPLYLGSYTFSVPSPSTGVKTWSDQCCRFCGAEEEEDAQWCPHCQDASYCGPACQQRDFKRHCQQDSCPPLLLNHPSASIWHRNSDDGLNVHEDSDGVEASLRMTPTQIYWLRMLSAWWKGSSTRKDVNDASSSSSSFLELD